MYCVSKIVNSRSVGFPVRSGPSGSGEHVWGQAQQEVEKEKQKYFECSKKQYIPCWNI